MTFQLKCTLIMFAIFVVIIQVTKGQIAAPAIIEEEDDWSSTETVEDSNESRRQRRRSAESSIEGTDVSKGQAKASLPTIPGLPDPETLKKIAEILTTVGQQVLPIFISGNSGVSDLVTNRATRDMKFFKKFKSELDILDGEMKKIKT